MATTAAMTLLALVALLWRLKDVRTPVEAARRLAADLAIGSGWVLAMNLMMAHWGVRVGWNPATALLAGCLGWPGVAALAIMAILAKGNP